jgi:methyl-accepting chemotaxis protein
MLSRRYATYGAILGFLLPVGGTLIEALTRYGAEPLGVALVRAQGAPLLWVIDVAPVILCAMAALIGRQQDDALALEAAKREHFEKTAAELFGSAQTLLSAVSSFSSMTVQTAASVRETTATMGQLGHTATQAALTAETVVGLAHKSKNAADEGLSAVERASGELAKISEEVRGLSQRIQALDKRMREVFEIASVVAGIADRSQQMAEAVENEAKRLGVGGDSLGLVVKQMRYHSDDVKRAASQVKGILVEMHKAVMTAVAAADVGVRRAEQGAQVASTTGEAIRKLAGALEESSGAAKAIAVVAQQQDHGIEEVLKAMNEIHAATEAAIASTQSVALQARSLNDLASGLRSPVKAA